MDGSEVLSRVPVTWLSVDNATVRVGDFSLIWIAHRVDNSLHASDQRGVTGGHQMAATGLAKALELNYHAL